MENLKDVVALYRAVEGALTEKKECTIPLHDYSGLHEGPGMWYVYTVCPHCSDGQVDIMCNRYYQFVMLNKDIVIPCSCGEEPTLGEVIVGVQPCGGGNK